MPLSTEAENSSAAKKLFDLGCSEQDQNKAVEYYQMVIKLISNMAIPFYDDRIRLKNANYNIAIKLEHKDVDEALKYYQAALTEAERLYAIKDQAYLEEVLGIHGDIIDCYVKKNLCTEAEATYRKMKATLELSQSPKSNDVGHILVANLYKIAQLLFKNDKVSEANKCVKEMVEEYKSLGVKTILAHKQIVWILDLASRIEPDPSVQATNYQFALQALNAIPADKYDIEILRLYSQIYWNLSDSYRLLLDRTGFLSCVKSSVEFGLKIEKLEFKDKKDLSDGLFKLCEETDFCAESMNLFKDALKNKKFAEFMESSNPEKFRKCQKHLKRCAEKQALEGVLTGLDKLETDIKSLKRNISQIYGGANTFFDASKSVKNDARQSPGVSEEQKPGNALAVTR